MNFKQILIIIGLIVTEMCFDMAHSAEVLCPKQFLAHRKGSPTCWVSYRLNSDTELCISHAQWVELLKYSQDLSLCGKWIGKWKVLAPPVNEENLLGKNEKRIFYRFYGSIFVPNHNTSSYIFGVIKNKIELTREKFSEILQHNDTFGISRKLFLNEDKPFSLFSFYRLVGFVHVFTITGIHLFYLAYFIQKILSYLCYLCGVTTPCGLRLSNMASFVTWFFVWVLSGMRPGMCRPWIILGVRLLAKRLGYKFTSLSPLWIAIFSDLSAAIMLDGSFLSFFYSFP
ncbi:MAG: ComEC/Rec2 family competence protein, partial [Bdellovibrio sp.]|nr:ComEC/Rec2 family competence protein [Bdellovibrio sp.]